MLDILKMIEELEEFGADSVKYKLYYRKDGIIYEIRMSIEEVGHDMPLLDKEDTKENTDAKA